MKRSLLCGAALLFVTACGGGGTDNPVAPPGNPSPPAVATVTVVLTNAQIVTGTSTSASAELRAANGTVLSGRSVTWSSSSPAVASVDGSGTVTALTAGTTTITATSGGRTGSASLTVTLPPVATVTVSLSNPQIVAGTSTSATAELRSDNGAVLTGRSVAWSSSAPSVASVDATGTVTALAAGTTTITATSEGRTGSASLRVTPPPVASVTVTLAQASVVAGTITSASATLRSSNGSPLDGRVVAWTSSNTSVAAVDASGRVTTVAPGTTSISATSEGQTGSATLTVLPVPVATVSISGASSLTPGATAQLSATIRDVNGAMLTDRTVVWGTSNSSIATVSATGLVSAVAPGTASISASSEGRTGTLVIQVRSAVTSVTLTGTARVKVGDSYQYSVTARTSDGNTISRPVSWSTTNPSAGTFTPAGLFTPAGTGTITIVATIDGVAWESPITAYDWLSLSGNGIVFTTLPSDNQISNQFGSSEYPELTFVCSSTGSFVAWVATDRFVTASGTVAFSFDGGTPVAETWLEFDNFSSLGKTGTNASVKSFAFQVAGSRLFTFAFGEFRGSAKAVSFRVSGLGPRLTPLLEACPGNNLQSVLADAFIGASSTMPSSIAELSTELEQLRRDRARALPDTNVPMLTGANASARAVDTPQIMRRR